MDLENGSKLLMFPMLTNGKVTAVIGGVINEERDFLYFDVYKESHPDRNYLIQTFQQHYNSLSLGRTTDVGEVVIIVKKPELKKPDPWDDLGGDGGHDMNGGNGDYGDGSGGRIGTPTTPVIPPLPPNTPIYDMKHFLKCLDITKAANLTVYAEKMGQGHGVGHAFISITQGSNTMTFGFYPKTTFTGMIAGPGVFGNDGGHVYTHSWNVGNITPTQLQQIIATSIAYSNYYYDLGYNNCADFTLTVLSYTGAQTSTSGIQNPNTVVEVIQKNNGNSVTGNSPLTNRDC